MKNTEKTELTKEIEAIPEGKKHLEYIRELAKPIEAEAEKMRIENRMRRITQNDVEAYYNYLKKEEKGAKSWAKRVTAKVVPAGGRSGR